MFLLPETRARTLPSTELAGYGAVLLRVCLNVLTGRGYGLGLLVVPWVLLVGLSLLMVPEPRVTLCPDSSPRPWWPSRRHWPWSPGSGTGYDVG